MMAGDGNLTNAKSFLIGLVMSLGLSGVAQAALQPVRLNDFTGGINDDSDPTQVAVSETPRAQNVVIDQGGLKPRKGFTLCGELPSGNAGKTLFTYSKSDGSSQMIVSDNINYYETPDCLTFTRFKDAESNTAIADFAVVRNKLWVVNRSTHAFTWDGSTTTVLDGSANTPLPAPPKCSLIDFWKERVFCGRTASAPSGIAFTDITDSAGNDLDPSTGTLSWPATNVIQVGEESDGPIYGMKVYRDRLYAFKENLIYRIAFNSRFDISVERTASNVGTRYDKTIQEIDGVLYFTGPLGVYAFDGDKVMLLSKKLNTKFDTLRQPKNDEQFKSWSIASDFDDGTMLQISTIQVAGSMMIENSLTEDWESGVAPGDISEYYPEWTEQGTTPNALYVGSNTVDGGYWLEFKAQGSGQTRMVASSTPTYQSTSETGLQFDLDIIPGSNSIDAMKAFFMYTTDDHSYLNETGYFLLIKTKPTVEIGLYKTTAGTEVLISSTTSIDFDTALEKEWQITRQDDGDIFVSTNGVQFLTGNDSSFGTSIAMGFAFTNEINVAQTGSQFRVYNIKVQESTGSWISDEFNAVTVSSWTAFEATQDNNGGSVLWQYRSGTGSANLKTKAWTAITPGVTPPIPSTDIFVQYQSSMTAAADNFGNTPEIQDVTQNYSQGDFVSQPMYSGYVDKRYWVTVTSGSSSSNNMAMVKSRDLNAWMFYDTQIGDITNFNDKWYALASTHSAIYRLENGTSDNGEAIRWNYETGDIEWGAPWVRKELQKITVEFRKDTAAGAKVGWSRDSGVSFTERDVNMSGTGRDSKTLFINGGNAFDFRFRVLDETLDESASILGVTGWARIYKVLE